MVSVAVSVSVLVTGALVMVTVVVAVPSKVGGQLTSSSTIGVLG